MNTENIVMCVFALILGMLLADMLKNVCGCKVVEGGTGNAEVNFWGLHGNQKEKLVNGWGDASSIIAKQQADGDRQDLVLKQGSVGAALLGTHA